MTVGNEEIRDLLVEIRDLLLPVADSYRPAYERRQAIRALLSTDKRRNAWALANGEITQREIAKKAGMDEGGASRFVKELRELGAIGEGPNPKREIDV
jgi:DNA-binding MarR family transcriptional regulator